MNLFSVRRPLAIFSLAGVISFSLFCLLIGSSTLQAQNASGVPVGSSLVPSVVPAVVPPVIPSRVLTAVDAKDMVLLKGNMHSLARAEFDRGAAPASLRLERMMLMLKRSDDQEKALRTRLDDQQNASSPMYHKWMSPQEFGREFGPSDADVAAVNGWLQSQGFEKIEVTNGRTAVEFSGDAARLKTAFHTEMHKFNVKGADHWANASEPQIPRALAPVVGGFLSLHNFRKAPQLHVLPEPITAHWVPGQRPELTTSTGLHAMGPADFKKIYNANVSGINGAGASIAVVGRTNINLTDIQNFFSVFAIAGNVPTVLLAGPDPGDLGGGEEDEAVLDISWSSSIAPGAKTTLVVSATTDVSDGVDLSEFYIINNNLADIMTESFGTCEALASSSSINATAANAEQAAAQGISYFVSTGDSGAAGCDNPSSSLAQNSNSVNILASTPFNTAVGGTMFNENGNDAKYWKAANDPSTLSSAMSYIPEDVWNESCAVGTCPSGVSANLFAGSGGTSTAFTKPAWQSGVAGIPSANARTLPDVSLSAAGHDPYLICITGSCATAGSISFAGIGGTSASTPSFAGIMALVVQKQGGRVGLANYTLYKLAASETYANCNGSSTSATPSSTCVFLDTTVGTNAVPGSFPAGVYNAGVAYDEATGLGSVNVTNLVNQWSSVTYTPTTTTLSLNGGTAVNVVHGTSVPVLVTVVPTGGAGTPTGDVSLLSSGQVVQGVDGFTLSGGTMSTSTGLLPGGTNSIVAHYAGDTTFGASDSAPVSVTVTAETSGVSLILQTVDANGFLIPFSSGPVGSVVYFNVAVGGGSGVGVPTGSLTVFDNGATVTTQALNSTGNVLVGTSTLAAGTHAITASYAGDASFGSSVSAVANATLTMPDFSLSSTSATAVQGGSGSSLITVHPMGTFAGAVALSASGMPSGVTAAFSPVSTTSSSTLTLTVSSAVAVGSYNVTVTGISGSLTHTTVVSLTVTVPPPNFTLSASPTSLTVVQGTSGTSTITVNPLNGFVGSVALTASGLPSGVTATPDPSSTVASSTLTFAATSTAATGTSTVTITGVSGGLTHMTTVSLTVNTAGDFTFTASPTSFTVTAGQPSTSTLTIAPLNGFIGTTAFGCSGLPNLSKCTAASVPNGSGTSTLTITTTAPQTVASVHPNQGSSSGQYIAWSLGGTFGVAGMFLLGIGGRRRRRVLLVVGSLAVLALLTILPACGGSNTPQIIPGTTPGQYTVTVTGTSGSVSHSVAVSLTVN